MWGTISGHHHEFGQGEDFCQGSCGYGCSHEGGDEQFPNCRVHRAHHSRVFRNRAELARMAESATGALKAHMRDFPETFQDADLGAARYQTTEPLAEESLVLLAQAALMSDDTAEPGALAKTHFDNVAGHVHVLNQLESFGPEKIPNHIGAIQTVASSLVECFVKYRLCSAMGSDMELENIFKAGDDMAALAQLLRAVGDETVLLSVLDWALEGLSSETVPASSMKEQVLLRMHEFQCAACSEHTLYANGMTAKAEKIQGNLPKLVQTFELDSGLDTAQEITKRRLELRKGYAASKAKLHTAGLKMEHNNVCRSIDAVFGDSNWSIIAWGVRMLPGQERVEIPSGSGVELRARVSTRCGQITEGNGNQAAQGHAYFTQHTIDKIKDLSKQAGRERKEPPKEGDNKCDKGDSKAEVAEGPKGCGKIWRADATRGSVTKQKTSSIHTVGDSGGPTRKSRKRAKAVNEVDKRAKEV